MNAAQALILTAAAVAGVAYAMPRPGGIAGTIGAGSIPTGGGDGGPPVDWPDAPSWTDPAAWLDASLGDLSPLPIFNDAAAALLGDTMNVQQLSSTGLATLKDEEGFSATPYPDYKGQSIGHGHLIKPGESFTSITRAQAEQLLMVDVAWAQEAVSNAVEVSLTVNQFDALVCLAYNIGAPAFRSSTLVARLNAGDYAAAAGEFRRWVYAGGQVNPTLVARRDREQILFEG